MKTPRALFLVIAVLGGCAAPSSPSTEARQQMNDWVALKANQVNTCAREHVAGVDDGISDAMTVAFALSLRCREEYAALVDALASTLDNQEQVRMFRRRAGTREARTERFLPQVMRNRQNP